VSEGRAPPVSTIQAYEWLVLYSGHDQAYIDRWLDAHPADALYLRKLKPVRKPPRTSC